VSGASPGSHEVEQLGLVRPDLGSPQNLASMVHDGECAVFAVRIQPNVVPVLHWRLLLD
jgi:hypothetical protein